MSSVFNKWCVRQRLAILLLGASASVAQPGPILRPIHSAVLLQKASLTLPATSSATPPATSLVTPPVTPSATASATPSEQSASGAQVIMKGIRFQPAQLTVRVGEAVTFKNEDIVAHTVTADDGSFDSGLIQPGDTWKMTVQKDGTIAYHCRPHPNMKATLVTTTATNSSESTKAQGGLPGFNPPRAPQELHPILVNFTAALLPLAFLSDLLGKWLKRSSLHSAGAWMVLYAAVITPLTAAAGWWWKSKAAGGLPPEVIVVHQWLGTALALIFIVLAIWRWRIYWRNIAPSWGYMGFALLVVLALVYQGSLGGLMAFGH